MGTYFIRELSLTRMLCFNEVRDFISENDSLARAVTGSAPSKHTLPDLGLFKNFSRKSKQKLKFIVRLTFLDF